MGYGMNHRRHQRRGRERFRRSDHPARRATSCRAFSLVEMIVVSATILMLLAMLLPGLSAAREQGRSVVCRSNLHQIVMANGYYAEQSGGLYVPGAANFLANLDRWHGKRSSVGEPFDSSRGLLAPFIGPEGLVRRCPTFPLDELGGDGFERGNGGYGYNNRYVGVQGRTLRDGSFVVDDDRSGVRRDRIARPGETVMFTDAAFAGSTLIEYSFAEPRFHPQYPGARTDPSIHFRHRGLANVGWCDGHVDAHQRTFVHTSGWYETDPDRHWLGWFGKADDNSLFDLD